MPKKKYVRSSRRTRSRQIQSRQTSWKAPDFLHFEKGTAWYAVVTIVILIILVVALYVHDWLLAGAMAAAMLAIFSYSKEKPAERQFRIDRSGIQVGNRKYKYDELKSFWIAATPHGKLLYLKSVNRFSPPIMINIGSNDEIKVRNILINHLPEERRSEALTEKINRWIRF